MIHGSRSLSVFMAIALSLAAVVSCSRGSGESSISQADLAERIGARRAPVILDVRTASEFRSGHIPGAINIPFNELSWRLGALDAGGDREIVVYCERGGRAMAAASELRRSGFSTVLPLQGGMSAWRASRLPCVGC